MTKQTESYRYASQRQGIKLLTTSYSEVVAAGADDSDIFEFTVVSTAGVDRVLDIEIYDGAISAQILQISIPANTGKSNGVPAIDLVTGGSVEGVSVLPCIQQIGTVRFYSIVSGISIRAKIDTGNDVSIIYRTKDY